MQGQKINPNLIVPASICNYGAKTFLTINSPHNPRTRPHLSPFVSSCLLSGLNYKYYLQTKQRQQTAIITECPILRRSDHSFCKGSEHLL